MLLDIEKNQCTELGAFTVSLSIVRNGPKTPLNPTPYFSRSLYRIPKGGSIGFSPERKLCISWAASKMPCYRFVNSFTWASWSVRMGLGVHTKFAQFTQLLFRHHTACLVTRSSTYRPQYISAFTQFSVQANTKRQYMVNGSGEDKRTSDILKSKVVSLGLWRSSM